jgi:hypothetical protein
MSTATTPRALKAIWAKRQDFLQQITRTEPVIVGNVYDVMRRCGNPSCHCAAKPGHRQTLLIYVEKGRRRCKFVRRADAEWVKKAWQRYRNCRKALGEIRALSRQELALLRAQIQKRRARYE